MTIYYHETKQYKNVYYRWHFSHFFLSHKAHQIIIMQLFKKFGMSVGKYSHPIMWESAFNIYSQKRWLLLYFALLIQLTVFTAITYSELNWSEVKDIPTIDTMLLWAILTFSLLIITLVEANKKIKKTHQSFQKVPPSKWIVFLPASGPSHLLCIK